MRVTICGPNLRDQSKGSFHIHAAGCADLKRGARLEPEYRNGWTIDADSRLEVCEDVYPSDQYECEPGDFIYDLHFFPCASGLS